MSTIDYLCPIIHTKRKDMNFSIFTHDLGFWIRNNETGFGISSDIDAQLPEDWREVLLNNRHDVPVGQPMAKEQLISTIEALGQKQVPNQVHTDASDFEAMNVYNDL